MKSFGAEVAEWLTDIRPVDPDLAITSVFRVLSRHFPKDKLARSATHCRSTFESNGRAALSIYGRPLTSIDKGRLAWRSTDGRDTM
jgi:hypothetical protein